MDRRTREAVRYLGYGKHAIDDRTSALLIQSFAELEEVVHERFVYRIFDLQPKEQGRLKIGTMDIKSSNLGRNLKGCGETVVFGATLGIGVDRLIKKRTVTDMASVVVLQACAAAMLEEYCDQCQEKLAEEFAAEGKYLRPRFSPGYGDFDIRHQGELLQMIGAAKRAGISMTENSMLIPTKSVTALIGISDTKLPCHREGCEACEKRDCLYRRD